VENERQKEIRMKAKVELVIRDEDKHLESARPLRAGIGLRVCMTLKGSENWRQKILPDIEADLFEARSPVQATAKNSELICNGTTLSTLRLSMENLSCSYRNIRSGRSYFELSNQLKEDKLSSHFDGARVIRNRLLTIFGTTLVVILDWYHLCKLRQLMSMIATNKVEESIHLKYLLPQLWRGRLLQLWSI